MSIVIAQLKTWLRRLLPKQLLRRYHQTMVRYGAWRHHYPSRKLVVIGVTGTKGKSTTANLIWHLLTSAGYTVGLASTVNFRIGDKHWLNTTKMTMLGRTQLQKLLSDMVAAKCQYAVVETSSEGIAQWRHLGVDYDIVVFTNLSPEHLDAHGNFENYKQAKLELFRYASTLPVKLMNGQSVHKVAVINGDDPVATEFIDAAQVESKYVWSQQVTPNVPANLLVSNVAEQSDGVTFEMSQYQLHSHLRGAWNVENMVSAIAVGLSQGLSYPDCMAALESFRGVPGRMELIDAGQPFTVVVDYAYEPKSLGLLYNFWRKQVGPDHKLITLVSSTGGGRDVWRREANGQVAAQLCDFVIVTDEDPYDEDPMLIMQAVMKGVLANGKVDKQNAWLIMDRKRAIAAACALAQPGDVVLLTAKGAEQKMVLAHGKKIDWDDREIVRQAIVQL